MTEARAKSKFNRLHARRVMIGQNSRIALAEGFLSSSIAVRMKQNYCRPPTGEQPADNGRATAGQRAKVLQKNFASVIITQQESAASNNAFATSSQTQLIS